MHGLKIRFTIGECSSNAPSAATIAGGFLKPLHRFCDEIDERQPHLTCEPWLVYGGDTAQQRSAAAIVPWSRLHQHTW